MTETIQESHIASSSSKPAKQKKLWISVVGGIVALSVLAVGFQAYKKYSFKSALRPYALKDNILTEDILALYSAPKATIGDNIYKREKNIEAREQIIQDVRMVDPGTYKSELDMYVEILKLENEYLQSEITRWQAYIKMKEAEKEKKYWDQSLCNNHPMELGCAERGVEVETATKRFYEEIRENSQTRKKWLSKEKEVQMHISSLLPPRNIIPILEKLIKAEE